MTISLSTPANKEHLFNITTKLDNISPLNRFGSLPHWSSDCIDADQVYRIQKLTQRLIEETGVILQDQITDMFEVSGKLFPYNMQLIKIDRNTFNTDIIVQDQVCQTITQLVEDCKTYVLENKAGDVTIDKLVMGDYALATYWTNYRDPKYKNWFIGKYMERYV